MILDLMNNFKAYAKPYIEYLKMILAFQKDFKAYLKLCIS